MRSPCLSCETVGPDGDKNSAECLRCKKRIEYARSLDPENLTAERYSTGAIGGDDIEASVIAPVAVSPPGEDRVRQLADRICKNCGVSFDDVLLRYGGRKVMDARRRLVVKLRDEHGCSFGQIGKLLWRDAGLVCHMYLRATVEGGNMETKDRKKRQVAKMSHEQRRARFAERHDQVEQIKAEACEQTGITIDDLKFKGRGKKELTLARRIICHRLRETFPDIRVSEMAATLGLSEYSIFQNLKKPVDTSELPPAKIEKTPDEKATSDPEVSALIGQADPNQAGAVSVSMKISVPVEQIYELTILLKHIRTDGLGGVAAALERS